VHAHTAIPNCDCTNCNYYTRLKGKAVDEYGNDDGEGQSYNNNSNNNSNSYSNSSSGKTGDSFSQGDKKSSSKYSKDTAVDGKSDEVCTHNLYSAYFFFSCS
jgi:hypothetical protein